MPLNSIRSIWWAFLMMAGAALTAHAQPTTELKPEKPLKAGRIKGQQPNQLDLFKVDLFQVGINEVRLWYEMEMGKHSSLEFGLGAIYKNGFWFALGGRPTLANGGGVYLAFRRYMDKKRYFSEPKVRSYFSPVVFYRYSQYKHEWIALETSGPTHPCNLLSENIHQAGLVMRFGWQTHHGRLALDFYTGLGFKFMPSTVTLVATTPAATTCGVDPTTVLVGAKETIYPTNVIFNGGIKLGIRRNNKERHYDDAPAPTPDGPDPEAPPQF